MSSDALSRTPPGHRSDKLRGAAGVLSAPAFPALTVTTPRLEVRGAVADDAIDVTEILADKQIRRWLWAPGEAGPADGLHWCTELAMRRRESGTGDHYCVVRREDERLVGLMWTRRTDWPTMSTEIGFVVGAHARGFGVAAEAVDALCVALMLEHGFQRIELRVVPGNKASRRVAEKAGFVYEGLLRNAGQVASGRVDLEMWSLVAGDLR